MRRNVGQIKFPLGKAVPDFVDFAGDEIRAGRALHLVAKDDFRRPGGVIRCSSANIRCGLSLGERDLFLGLFSAAGNEIFQPLGALMGQ
jgi:hypothetical protein